VSEHLPGSVLRERLAAWTGRVSPGWRFRHRRTHRPVTVSCLALEEATLTPQVVYRDDDTLIPFTRPAEQFCERFERLVSV
jgi:hypothetical protein